MDKQNGRLWITDIAGVTGDVFEKIVGKYVENKRKRKFGPPPPLGYPKVGPERITMRMGWPSIQFKGPGIHTGTQWAFSYYYCREGKKQGGERARGTDRERRDGRRGEEGEEEGGGGIAGMADGIFYHAEEAPRNRRRRSIIYYGTQGPTLQIPRRVQEI